MDETNPTMDETSPTLDEKSSTMDKQRPTMDEKSPTLNEMSAIQAHPMRGENTGNGNAKPAQSGIWRSPWALWLCRSPWALWLYVAQPAPNDSAASSDPPASIQRKQPPLLFEPARTKGMVKDHLCVRVLFTAVPIIKLCSRAWYVSWGQLRWVSGLVGIRGARALNTCTHTHTSGYTHSVLTVFIVHSIRVHCAHYTQTPPPSSSTVCLSRSLCPSSLTEGRGTAKKGREGKRKGSRQREVRTTGRERQRGR
jgi:hypothetical protein